MSNLKTFICPICLTVMNFEYVSFPKCHKHYMVELEDWEHNKEAYLVSREYEMSLLPRTEQRSIEELSSLNKKLYNVQI